MKIKLLQLVFLTFALAAHSQNFSQLAKLEASDQQADDNHAISVAISGDYAIAGAWHEGTLSDPPLDAGAAYIFQYNSATEEWTEQAKLIAADREAGDEFGISVDISGTYAVIGAPIENGAEGAAYVFEKDGSGVWVQVEKLEAPFEQSNDRFGFSVAISGNTIIVGAQSEDEDENETNTLQNAGSVYVFTRVGGVWGFSQKIVASDRDVNDQFGWSVGIHEDKIIVGAYRYNPDGFEIGAAYAFALVGGTWEETRIIKAATSATDERFGWSVDVFNNFYIVGAPDHDVEVTGGGTEFGAGAAYIYDADNSWAEAIAIANNPRSGDELGVGVAIYETRAVVGAPLQDTDIDGDPPFLSSSGAIFVFEKDGDGFWNQAQKLLTSDRFTGDKFGHSVDIEGINIIGGAPEDNQDEPPAMASTGALYVFNDGTLAVNENDISHSLDVYPNPSDGEITILFGEKYAEIDLTVQNILGQVINSKKYRDANFLNINIEGVSGIYLIHILTSDGKFATKKIFIK